MESIGVRIAFFGTFFPEFRWAGNSSTGFVYLFSESKKTAAIEVYCQIGSRLPGGLDPYKVTLVPVWRHDDPISTLKAGIRLCLRSKKFDLVVFNTYPTAFGKSRVANTVGLGLPVLVSILTRKTVGVYLHNLLETQDVRALGYNPSLIARVGVRLLEILVLRYSDVVVPLEGQAEQVRRVLSARARHKFVPYIDGIYLPALRSHGKPDLQSARPIGGLRVLMIGNWGPQKDLEGAIAVLASARNRIPGMRVLVVGGPTPQFPEYHEEFRRLVASLPSDVFEVLGPVSEERVWELIVSSDVVLLPYLATGGYSGAMSLAGLAGRRVIAYDLPQLREQARLLEMNVIFVNRFDREQLLSDLCSLNDKRCTTIVGEPSMRERVDKAVAAVETLLSSWIGG